MITGLDRTTLLVRDLEAAVATYRRILAREPVLLATDDGLASAIFALDNMTLRLASPKGGDGEGLVELAFRVDDIERWFRRLRRLSLSPAEISDTIEQDSAGTRVSHKRTAIPAALSHGMDISFRHADAKRPASPKQGASITGIDLIVLNTDDPERAMAFYGARLGLALIYDQTNARTNSRLMQFACGDMVLEIVHKPAEGEGQRPDRLWGIGWSVESAEDTRERLARAGLNVSEVKDGAKRGTRVFTIRDGTCNVPTLVVQHLPGAD
jgi:catechol 2,3-dioxygenase-like lactoylglutathione lyase family enzyme